MNYSCFFFFSVTRYFQLIYQTSETLAIERLKTAKWDEYGPIKLSAWRLRVNDLTRKANIYPMEDRVKTAISTLPEWMQIKLNEIEFNSMSQLWRVAEEIYKNRN